MRTPTMAFSLQSFCSDFPEEGIREALMSEGFDSLPALLCADQADVESLDLKKGHKKLLKEAISNLQSKSGKGPLASSPKSEDFLNVSGVPLREFGRPTSEHFKGSLSLKSLYSPGSYVPYLKIVDYVSSTFYYTDEEAEDTMDISLNVNNNSRLTLAKVSPAMWIAANSRIMAELSATNELFSVKDYIRYTEMIGEFAERYSWKSVVFFDDNYRKRQAKLGFAWGTEASHLSTMILRDRELDFSSDVDRITRPAFTLIRELCKIPFRKCLGKRSK